jgi:hypothetical protein
MARPTRDLISALRSTADRLESTTSYQWGHMGMCNCGHLAQAATGLTAAEIHSAALAREGDWEHQAVDYCATSGQLIDHILAAMFALGLTREDVRHLEKLSDDAVLRSLPTGRRYLRFNQRDDVIEYIRAWADVLDRHLESTTAQLAAASAL